MAKKVKVPVFTVNVQRDVLFEARIEAPTFKEALNRVLTMTTEELWDTPGSVLDDNHKITAIFS